MDKLKILGQHSTPTRLVHSFKGATGQNPGARMFNLSGLRKVPQRLWMDLGHQKDLVEYKVNEWRLGIP